ncbi:MAG TPA: hypothetical protein VME66_15295 [Candidatus Acidoferrales bacterium]|nr:hypothetical protein [Candidatus Acidoferrales bacterium]
MTFHRTDRVKVAIPQAALTAIFDDCDRFERDETGGRLVGTYEQHAHGIVIDVRAVIESGPSARRSNVSFFQDGEYQERRFRELEDICPAIEHLGNWHTHHVNGHPTLSGGDVQTYQRIVNHEKHNTDFFYAVLVTAKNRRPKRDEQRYHIKHYFLRRGDERVYEIPAEMVDVTNAPLLTTAAQPTMHAEPNAGVGRVGSSDRARDGQLVASDYPRLRTFAAKNGAVYWRGEIELADGSAPEVVVMEDASASPVSYAVGFRSPAEPLRAFVKDISERRFASAHAALLSAERGCNRALFDRFTAESRRK